MKSRLTAFIKTKCIEHGFYKAGISAAEKLNNEEHYLKQWLNENRNADMKWIDRSFEKRINPELVMNDVKSIISLMYIYDTPVSHPESRDIPKISRYAWGERDYHKILKKKLKNICGEIENFSQGLKTKFYVDDGPVMEKVWAAKSGIGWIGKNTNLINSEAGSFFFLSEIYINAELDYDKPVEDLCKSCNLCINACPTGALYEEYKLDANLCISYQTIENRNEIPEEIILDGWIFGCDICQDVCPFNSSKIFTEDLNFYPKKEIFDKKFNELLKMTEEDFNKTFEGTPVRRTKYSGWRRNLFKAKRMTTI